MKCFIALVIWHHYYIDNTSEIRISQKWYKNNIYAYTEMNEMINNKKC